MYAEIQRTVFHVFTFTATPPHDRCVKLYKWSSIKSLQHPSILSAAGCCQTLYIYVQFRDNILRQTFSNCEKILSLYMEPVGYPASRLRFTGTGIILYIIDIVICFQMKKLICSCYKVYAFGMGTGAGLVSHRQMITNSLWFYSF